MARSRLFVALSVLAVTFACRKDEPPPPQASGPSSEHPLPTPTPTPSATGSSEAAARSLAEARRTLSELRERRISLAAPPPAPRRLAFGSRFLVQLGVSEVVSRRTLDGSSITRSPLAEPRLALELAGGYVLAGGGRENLLLQPGLGPPRQLPRLPLLPGSVVEVSRESPDYVWIVSPSSQAQRFVLQAPNALAPEREFALPGYLGGPLATSSGGSFVYAVDATLHRVSAAGRAETFSLPREAIPVWRLAAARHMDQVWAVTTQGEVLLLELSRPIRTKLRFQGTPAPLDFAVTRSALALLGLLEAPNVARRLQLEIYSSNAERLFSRVLDADQPGTEDDWAAHWFAQHQVALAETPPRVAVGGERRLVLVDYRAGVVVPTSP